MNTDHDHSRLDLIEYAGEFQVCITGMDVVHAIGYLDLRRKNKTIIEKIESNPKLRTPILAFYFQ